MERQIEPRNEQLSKGPKKRRQRILIQAGLRAVLTRSGMLLDGGTLSTMMVMMVLMGVWMWVWVWVVVMITATTVEYILYVVLSKL